LTDQLDTGTSQTYKMSDLFRLTEVQMEHLRPFSPKSRGRPSWGRVIRNPRIAIVRQGTNSTCNERQEGPHTDVLADKKCCAMHEWPQCENRTAALYGTAKVR